MAGKQSTNWAIFPAQGLVPESLELMIFLPHSLQHFLTGVCYHISNPASEQYIWELCLGLVWYLLAGDWQNFEFLFLFKRSSELFRVSLKLSLAACYRVLAPRSLGFNSSEPGALDLFREGRLSDY